jgi:hypothetical protein
MLDYPEAAARLIELLEGDRLGQASNEAYELGGTAIFLRVGPMGDRAGLSKRVRVQMLPPHTTETGMRLSFRWMATGISGHLFPALDADLDLVPSAAQTSTLILNARYQPPLGALGEEIDRVLLGRAAELTLAALLHRLAVSLTAPEREPVPPAATDGLRLGFGGECM